MVNGYLYNLPSLALTAATIIKIVLYIPITESMKMPMIKKIRMMEIKITTIRVI
jgi:hypothetical protein